MPVNAVRRAAPARERGRNPLARGRRRLKPADCARRRRRSAMRLKAVPIELRQGVPAFQKQEGQPCGRPSRSPSLAGSRPSAQTRLDRVLLLLARVEADEHEPLLARFLNVDRRAFRRPFVGAEDALEIRVRLDVRLGDLGRLQKRANFLVSADPRAPGAGRRARPFVSLPLVVSPFGLPQSIAFLAGARRGRSSDRSDGPAQ
jgi:hypothetical protein